jgi:hypothetical protein
MARTAGGGLLAQQNAVRAQQQALVERDNATRNFGLARQTAESLIVDIASGLRHVQGVSAESVRRILETAKSTFERLAGAAPDDVDVQVGRAAMLDQFGETYLALGDLGSAVSSRMRLPIIGKALPSPYGSPPLMLSL